MLTSIPDLYSVDTQTPSCDKQKCLWHWRIIVLRLVVAVNVQWQSVSSVPLPSHTAVLSARALLCASLLWSDLLSQHPSNHESVLHPYSSAFSSTHRNKLTACGLWAWLLCVSRMQLPFAYLLWVHVSLWKPVPCFFLFVALYEDGTVHCFNGCRTTWFLTAWGKYNRSCYRHICAGFSLNMSFLSLEKTARQLMGLINIGTWMCLPINFNFIKRCRTVASF